MEKLNKELAEKVRELIAQEEVVKAMSLVQQSLRCGLREAKEQVDAIRRELGKINF